jgi:hypothetical protein
MQNTPIVARPTPIANAVDIATAILSYAPDGSQPSPVVRPMSMPKRTLNALLELSFVRYTDATQILVV